MKIRNALFPLSRAPSSLYSYYYRHRHRQRHHVRHKRTPFCRYYIYCRASDQAAIDRNGWGSLAAGSGKTTNLTFNNKKAGRRGRQCHIIVIVCFAVRLLPLLASCALLARCGGSISNKSASLARVFFNGQGVADRASGWLLEPCTNGTGTGTGNVIPTALANSMITRSNSWIGCNSHFKPNLFPLMSHKVTVTITISMTITTDTTDTDTRPLSTLIQSQIVVRVLYYST